MLLILISWGKIDLNNLVNLIQLCLVLKDSRLLVIVSRIEEECSILIFYFPFSDVKDCRIFIKYQDIVIDWGWGWGVCVEK